RPDSLGQIGIVEIFLRRVSNIDLFQKRRDVLFLEADAPGALAGIRDRPLVLKRFVDGAEGRPFYQILSLARGRPESSDQRPDIRHPIEP
ncbi:MAG: hypothetical protein ACREQW_02795, partial [Candidatus Binatia bacterium]